MRAGEDTVANRELVRRGHRAYRSSELVLVHHSPCTNLRRLVLHHFTRGRWWRRILQEDAARANTAKRRTKGAPTVRSRMKDTTRNVERWGGQLAIQYRRAWAFVLAGAVAAWAGAQYERLRFWDRPEADGAAAASLLHRSPFAGAAKRAARRYEVPETLFLALIHQESGWQPAAVSPAGAIGLGQLMPETARTLEVDPWDPEQNIEGAARYLRSLYERFGSWPLALAAYNAGPHQVDRYGGVPPFPETRRYVEQVLGFASLSPVEGS